MVNTILAKRVNHIVAKGDNPVWPKGSKSRGFSKDWTINDNRIIECLFERSDLQKSLIEKNPVSSKAAQQIVSRIKSTPNFKDSELGQLLKMKYD